MKKQIAIALGLAVLSTGAFASKARVEALGQDANGSLYLDDARNIFLNPAQLNYHKDFVTLELGNTNQETAMTADIDSASTPKAEGGIFKSQGNMVYGIYFGAESNTANNLRFAAMGADVVSEQNNIDLFIAGDAGVQWGARLTYGKFEDNQQASGANEKSSSVRLALGAITGDLEGYLNLGIDGDAEGANGAELNGKTSYDFGIVYNMNGIDLMGSIQSIGAEDGMKKEFKATNFRVGVAKKHRLNDKASAWISAFYRRDKSDNDFVFTAAAAPEDSGEVKSTYIPVVIGIETQVKDWLTLRGSVTHELFGTTANDDGDKATRANSTTVAAGASLTWGDLSVDGMIGNTDGATTGNNTATGNGTLRTDSLLSRVSLTYKF